MPSKRRSRKRPYAEGHVPLDVGRATGGRRSVSSADGEWVEQRIRSSDRAYTCPVCHQEVPAGTAHIVAWRTDVPGGPDAGLEARRHWHTSCWQRRANLH